MAESTPAGSVSGRTNLGPLTTAFSYPASCATNVQACSSCPTVYQAQSCGTNTFNSLGIQDAPDCWPPRSNTDISTGVAFNGWGFYSPGVSCPIGYERRCSATGTRPGGFPFQFPPLETETAIGCCPTGYICRFSSGFDHGQTCITVATDGVDIPTIQCSSGAANATGTLQVPFTTIGTPGGRTTTGTVTTVTMYAPLIQLMVQATDMSSSAPTSSGGPSSNTSSPGGGDGGGNGLSKGGAAGIGVACGLVGIAAIAGVVLLLMRTRKTKTPADVPLSPQTPLQDPPAKYKTLPIGREELGVQGQEIYEAPNRPPQWAHTRPAGEAPAELPASYR